MASVISRLYRGQTHYPFVAKRKLWYAISAVLMVICIGSIAVRQFNFGVDFAGGNSLRFSTGDASIDDVNAAVEDSGVDTETVQQVGSGGSATFVIKTAEIPAAEVNQLKDALASDLGDKIDVDGHALTGNDISQEQVSGSWGRDITQKAIVALVVFLILVTIVISALFEWRLAVGAIVGVFHDLIAAAGIYALVGFEVTPSTVVGLLTILGYSLYDNIVVYDKVRENTRGLLTTVTETYSDAANRAINETLARSINTSLIALLPVAGLLFVGAGMLGVGTIKDLALVLFVGLACGAYSSLFLATPIGCDLKERQPEFAELARRVANKRAKQEAKIAAPLEEVSSSVGAPAVVDEPARPPAPNKPRPGARPTGRRPQARRRR